MRAVLFVNVRTYMRAFDGTSLRGDTRSHERLARVHSDHTTGSMLAQCRARWQAPLPTTELTRALCGLPVNERANCQRRADED
jgi:hypothetical protein